MLGSVLCIAMGAAMKPLAAFVVPSLLVIAAAMPCVASDETRTIASCVSHESLQFKSGDARAMLDEADRELVSAAMLERYPVLQGDSFTPTHIILWQRQGGELLYVTLLANPQKPGDMCFTATFSASRFEFTQMLQKKYFVSGLKQA
jgi:hypothetical protein